MLLDIDDEFIVNAGELKHNTILNSKPVYNHTLPGRQISVVVDGIIDFSTDIEMYVGDTLQQDEFETSSEIQFRDNIGETVFTLPPPIAYEVNGSESVQCLYKVIKIGNVISLKIFTPYAWIEDSGRTFPLAIDPTLQIIGAGNNASQVYNGVISNNNTYLSVHDNNAYRRRLYKINQSQKTLEETPFFKNTIIDSRVDSQAAFSPDDRYFFCGGVSTFDVYQYNRITQDYDTLIFRETNKRTNAVYITDNSKYLFKGNNYALECCKFDPNHPTQKLTILSSIGTSYYPRKIYLTKNENYLFCQQGTGGATSNITFRIYLFSNGVISSNTLNLPSPLTVTNIVDFAVTNDEKFIIFSRTTAPYILICPFDSNSGSIGTPISVTIDMDTAPARHLVLSKKNQYLVMAQSTANYPRFSIYNFDKDAGIIDEKVHINPVDMEPFNTPYELKFSPDGSLLLYSQAAAAPNSMFLYKFLHEPENNIYFKDPGTEDYYSDNKGNTLMLIDFGTIVAGQTTSPKEILLENCYDYAVNNIQLSISNPSQGFRVELSETDLPFIPQQTLSFNQTLDTRETIPFYIRVTTTDQSQSGGMFEVLAKCDVV